MFPLKNLARKYILDLADGRFTWAPEKHYWIF